jgi:hypothetical protein
MLIRMLLCAEVNAEDFYVIHHEMGHVEYYMAYRNQPTVFQVYYAHSSNQHHIELSRLDE